MKKRIMSAMLALLMALSSVGVLCTIPTAVLADEADSAGDTTETTTATDIAKAALTTVYTSAQDKLDSDENMNLVAKYKNYELYANAYTGEVGVKDTTTGQILLSNPYDAPNDEKAGHNESTLIQLMSQIELCYKNNDTVNYMYSYKEAAERGQIRLKSIRNGVRIEYTMGRQDANYLAPGRITEERMIEMIFSKIDPGLDSYDSADLELGRYNNEDLMFLIGAGGYKLIKTTADSATLNAYPIVKTLGKNIYVRTENSVAKQKRIEEIIKTYCKDYTTEEMEKDHLETDYKDETADPPLFKLSLEYTLSDDGLLICLPANGIRFNSSLYSLEYISPLKYFGAGNMTNDGYLFYPDGSGTILYYSDLLEKGTISTLSGKVYGADYAYHEVSGKHQETIRMPVFGLVNEDVTVETDEEGNAILDEEGNTIVTDRTRSGFLAILEDGNAMASIKADWGNTQHNYASVYTTYYPRPKDSYDLSSSMSVSGSNTKWTVEASRKYTGSYKMRIIMLQDESQQATKIAHEELYFEASYVGMAKAYSNYLVNTTQTLQPLTALDVHVNQIPLYIEAFGTVPDTEKILSIPVDVDVPLTTFENIKTMYKELSENGISNVNFKLTGFANGGMYSTYPSKLKWMDEVGGADGFLDLVSMAKEYNFGIYPDFDFMYISNEEIFDGVDLRTAAARTIDNRYSSKQVYDATYQQFVSYFDICVTPVMVEEYYARFSGDYQTYSPVGISVGTLGSDLNSDFGKKNPTNREDAKTILSAVLAKIEQDYSSVMTTGGNAYVLPYIEHLLEAAVDSSRFSQTSCSVPFVGIVLHGYVNFAGPAINMAGNVNYQILKAIENGAGLYFTLSYDNTSLLKEYEDLSKYYSVNYKIWAGEYDEAGNLIQKGELFEVYERVNDAIGMLQTAKIVDHKFLIGERVASDAEKEADRLAYENAWTQATEEATEAARKQWYKDNRDLIDQGQDPIPDFTVSQEDIQAKFDQMGLAKTETTSSATDSKYDYERTKYTLDDGLIVMVTYEGGYSFILNYNVYAVNVTLNGVSYTLDAYDYQLVRNA